jgi:hypothetical protein
MLSTIDKMHIINTKMSSHDDDLESQMKYVRLMDDDVTYTQKQKIEDINKTYMALCLIIVFVPFTFVVIILITHYLR